MRPNPNKARKLKKFGMKKEEWKEVEVPEPPPDLATPSRRSPPIEGILVDSL